MLKKIAVIAVIFISSQCHINSSFTFDQIELVNGIYLNKIDKVPVNGNVVYKLDNGAIMGKTFFVNGIPSGNWVSYGYDGEIIYEGKLEQLNVKIDSWNVY